MREAQARFLFVLCGGCIGAILGGITINLVASAGARAHKAARWDEHCDIVRASLENDARILREPSEHEGITIAGPRTRAWVAAHLWTESSPPYQSKELALECDVPRTLLEIADACPREGAYSCLADAAQHAARAISEAP